MLLTDPREGAEQREANKLTSLQQTVSRSRRIVSRISDVSIVGQCPAIMPRHSHPTKGARSWVDAIPAPMVTRSLRWQVWGPKRKPHRVA